ncbi:ankyrin repeat-containing protein ITN1-like [Salvia hispanica]|uniref:ankyrin repeat-containing protein ITN1-like n=1 Tax=Salvia hispanica TaxID=49212 RepID=UPI00200990C9|nr:ankyrin repeat-containing protein ITN1-like [Salvia hispanica]
MGIFISKILGRQHEGINLNENGYSSSHRERRQRTDRVLHRAALKGDWNDVEELLTENEDLAKTAIMEGGEIALHIAAVEGHETFVSKLLEILDIDDVATLNMNGCTALCFAAAAGHVEIARIMLQKHPNLADIKGETGVWPLYMAALQGFEEMADFLYRNSDIGLWTPLEKVNMLTSAIDSELYDLAMRIVDEDKTLVVARDINGETPLQVLARSPSAFSCDNGQGFWDKIVRNVLPMKKSAIDMNARCNAKRLMNCLWDAAELCKEDIEAARTETVGVIEQAHVETTTVVETTHAETTVVVESTHAEIVTPAESVEIDQAAGATESEDIEANEARAVDSSTLFFIAAESGNDEFIVELFKNDHNLLYKVNDNSHSIFHVAVSRRYVNVFNLMYELGGTKDLIATYIDDEGNNILHLAAELAPQNQLDCIPGAAWQMQREVLWFKAVEKLVRPAFKHKKNKEGKTPRELFVAKHEGLRAEGEKFMKQTAKSCMVVTVLIATVVFTTAFTVPGGYNRNGAPILENKRMFVIFPVSEAVATLSSLTSMLMFLSILTSRYSDEDFLTALPIWMVVGVSTLFFSIVAMMVAFCSCLLFFEHGRAAAALLLVLFGSVPIMFEVLKYRLLRTILRCTYSCTGLFRSHNRLHS